MIVEQCTFFSEEPATEIAILLLAFGHEEVANRIIAVVLLHVLCEKNSPILLEGSEYSQRSISIGTLWRVMVGVWVAIAAAIPVKLGHQVREVGIGVINF